MDVKATLEASFREEWLRRNEYNNKDIQQRELSQLSENIAKAIPLEQLTIEINKDIELFLGQTQEERQQFHERNLRILGIFYAMILGDLARTENPPNNKVLFLNDSTYEQAYAQLREDLLSFIKIYPCIKPRSH